MNKTQCEEDLLGALLSDAAHKRFCCRQVHITDFEGARRDIFSVIAEKALMKEPVSVDTVADGLKSRDLLEEIGGREYLEQLTQTTHGDVVLGIMCLTTAVLEAMDGSEA